MLCLQHLSARRGGSLCLNREWGLTRRMPSDGKKIGKGPRQDVILGQLRVSPALRIRDLAAQFSVTTETIRRDLDDLGGRGLLNRTYGGAAGSPLVLEPNFEERSAIDVEERAAAARGIAQIVQDGNALMIDAGVTTIYVAKRLAAQFKDLTVVTNGFGVASALASNPGIHVMFCPGQFDGHEGGVSGEETVAFLRRFNSSLTIIGASGLEEEGPTDARSSSAWVKRTMIERAEKAAVVVGKSKFGKRASQLICPLNLLDYVVSDETPPAGLNLAMRSASVELILSKE
jgi:DeoR family glycerol-3-phosphate regulon repressor